MGYLLFPKDADLHYVGMLIGKFGPDFRGFGANCRRDFERRPLQFFVDMLRIHVAMPSGRSQNLSFPSSFQSQGLEASGAKNLSTKLGPAGHCSGKCLRSVQISGSCWH